MFSYALSFTFTDIISEIYGLEAGKLAVRVGFGGLILSVIFFMISIHAPAASFWPHQEAYETVLGFGPRLLLGGWSAYMVSQHLDVWIFHKLKEKTSGRHMWLRNNGSTLVSQFIDTCIYVTISFYGVFPVWEAIWGQYLIKLMIALLDTPIVYLAVRFLRSDVVEKA